MLRAWPRTLAGRQSGLTLVEIMVAMTISLMLLVALVSVLANASRSHNEMSKVTDLIEGGRFSVKLLQNEIVHAGFWGGYVPGFDNLTSSDAPGDAPQAIPNPCQAYNTWDAVYRAGLLGIPIQSSDELPTGVGCLSPLPLRAGTDMLLLRHADTCAAGLGACEPETAGTLYFQPTFCAAERNAGVVQSASSNTVTLGLNASDQDGEYVGVMLRTTAGSGAGQYRTITAYDGGSRVATVSPNWTVTPDGTTTYALEYALGVSGFPLHKRDCVGVGAPASLPITAGEAAEKRKFISDIYYITDVAHPEKPGEVIPTLVRSRFGALAQQPPQLLIEGVEALRVELGVDDVSDSGDPVDYTTAIDWADATKTSPTNRGDGAPDEFVRCTSASPCTAQQLSNVVAVKLYLLTRTRERTPGYRDEKSYCLGEPEPDGECPAASTIAAANDEYKRHVFVTSVRLHNVSGRRETP